MNQKQLEELIYIVAEIYAKLNKISLNKLKLYEAFLKNLMLKYNKLSLIQALVYARARGKDIIYIALAYKKLQFK